MNRRIIRFRRIIMKTNIKEQVKGYFTTGDGKIKRINALAVGLLATKVLASGINQIRR